MSIHSHHTVHIPVMGTGFTVDTPIKIAKYGLSSVMSIGDDELCENMRQHYCQKYGETFEPISKKEEQYRPRRITAYLNCVDRWIQQDFKVIVEESFEDGLEINKYFQMLPDSSDEHRDLVKISNLLLSWVLGLLPQDNSILVQLSILIFLLAIMFVVFVTLLKSQGPIFWSNAIAP